MGSADYRERLAVVLHRPRLPENVGAAARAACNMGVPQILLVAPENWDPDRALKMATHSAAHLVEGMEVHGNLASALAPFHYVVGTTARTGGQRKDINTPREIAQALIPICKRNRVALLFGPEDRGLTNAELRYCHSLVTIPTAGFSSLNLAQAVMILCYELFLAWDRPTDVLAPRLANRRELDGMYEHLKETFIRINFLHPENPDHGMQNVRRFLSRVALRSRDVKVIRGICRQIQWYIQVRSKRIRGEEK